MAARLKPPFRADHVGSLLRPANLHDARAKSARGEIDAAALRKVEDAAIRDVVALQEDIGLQGISDGEFRRTWWHFDFLSGFDGFELGAPLDKGTFQGSDEQPPRAMITAKLARSQPVMVDHFTYLNGLTEHTAKFTVPGPSMAHFRAGREGISEAAYPDLAEFWADLTAAYRAELGDLAANGCRYLQLDDISYAYLCDDDIRANLKSRGDDADELALTYAQALNDAIRDLPDDVTTAMHMCRGNFQSTWAAQGGYEPVAERVFNTVSIDALFMEYDSERAGGFAPLRFVPDDKIVVLGLVTTKTAPLETKDTLKRRIDEAARYIDLDRLCLSPQCGFSSTHHGNKITEADEIAKLRLIVEVAAEVWG
ncbi:MAG: 5-methyltetrahydropteroyltriglutamate--homocysteine S-methyltransferase [Rhodospirillaceae bacterium]|jgi:5-methyltetrahydropteroyltriglutamate--homocysteine methyltransferase|nr:5-methyltetrahydropteroyltriglutamate--homocysteine S-methyltransferase [Rhodospirillaceae bacterium]MBT3492363.1 5-methyltetrahydropteroyltriglutamate--homocysteine S-methyltransferase [Rhodospirillaceae bacterium]MBT3780017.1 5-methyltetrahydropteroyltriglutamate--homocysteine S-methyltransferase [Rhodospirillaceae bacterium]MBT3978683.1 5-methyltetrahydropteroyltriglutamate--homocysteine S-methyltransferase [Rhodospirillaceae bacterium]MBT4168455.1 5-methyltetrahydropteroyltriglutamate--h